MRRNAIAERIDNTLLRPDASREDVRRFIEESAPLGFRSLVVPSWAISMAVSAVRGTPTGVSAVVGFPHGTVPPVIKIREIETYSALGVTDLDVVAPIYAIRSGDWNAVEEEIRAICAACRPKVFKLIIETPLLSPDEIIRLCELSLSCDGPDFLKTGTGFSGKPTTPEHVRLLRAHLGGRRKIKASGGVRTLGDALAFFDAGADVIGTSAGISILRENDVDS